MSDGLTTYLEDHLAGAMHAIELLKAMRDNHKSDPLGQFASQMLTEIEADRDVLAGLTKRVGGSPGGPKEWGSWLAEKVSRLKLKHGSDDLGTFEALEFLVVGIHGKLSLWRALPVAAGCDSRLQGMDFDKLASRALDQHAKVEEQRLAAAPSALCAVRKS